MLQREDLLGIAPTPLPNRRPDRYIGEDGGIPLEALHPDDLEGLRALYRAMEDLYGRWLETRPATGGSEGTSQAEARRRAEIAEQIRAFGDPPLSTFADALGDRTRSDADVPWNVRRAIHDLRGGALFALRLYGGLPAEELANDPETLLSSVFLARDQAKMIRNILPRLDPEGRARDESEKEHAIADVLEKWDGFRLPGRDDGEGVRVRSEFFGALASCCLEASTIDRILFNLLNNALRFGEGHPVSLQVLPVEGGALRWVVSNALTDDHFQWLKTEVSEGGAGVFRAGLTRGGEGTGLASCAEFIASAFGLGGADEALTHGYVGARWVPGRFDARFHWPLMEVA